MTVARTWRRIAAPLAVVAVSFAAVACSGDDGNDDKAARNSSNFNTRSIVAFGAEVPTMPGAEIITRGSVKAGAWHKTYDVSATPTDVVAFYVQELPGSGWTEGGTPSPTPGGFEATWRRRGLRLDVTVAPSTTAGTSPTAADPATSTGSPTSTVNLTLDRTTDR
jgi:hypothetical protein